MHTIRIQQERLKLILEGKAQLTPEKALPVGKVQGINLRIFCQIPRCA